MSEQPHSKAIDSLAIQLIPKFGKKKQGLLGIMNMPVLPPGQKTTKKTSTTKKHTQMGMKQMLEFLVKIGEHSQGLVLTLLLE